MQGRSTLQVNKAYRAAPHVRVHGERGAVVSQASGVLLVETIHKTGLDAAQASFAQRGGSGHARRTEHGLRPPIALFLHAFVVDTGSALNGRPFACGVRMTDR